VASVDGYHPCVPVYTCTVTGLFDSFIPLRCQLVFLVQFCACLHEVRFYNVMLNLTSATGEEAACRKHGE
jgi:hypothetical protein